jgi:hypothetical protein
MVGQRRVPRKIGPQRTRRQPPSAFFGREALDSVLAFFPDQMNAPLDRLSTDTDFDQIAFAHTSNRASGQGFGRNVANARAG